MGNCNEVRKNDVNPKVLESVLKYINVNRETYPIYSCLVKYKDQIISKSKNFLIKSLKDNFSFVNFQTANNSVKTIRLNNILKDTRFYEEEVPVHKMIFGDLSSSFKPNLSNMEPLKCFSLGKKTFLTIYTELERNNLYQNMNQNPIIREEEFVTIYSERSKQYKIVKLDPTALLEVSLPRNQVHINNSSSQINKIKSNLCKFEFKTIKKLKYIFCKRNDKILYLSLHENNCIYAWVFAEETGKTVTIKLISNVTHAMLSGFFVENENEEISEKINDFDICYDINSHIEYNVLSNKEVEITDLRIRGLCYDTEVYMISTYPQHAVAFFVVINDRMTYHKIINLSFKLENPNLVIEEENSANNVKSMINNLFAGPVSIYNSVDKEFITLYYTGNKIVRFNFKFTAKLNEEDVMVFDATYNQSLLELPMLANSTIITINQVNYSNISILYCPDELQCKMILILNVKLSVINNLELVFDDYYKQEFEASILKNKLVLDEETKSDLFVKYVEEIHQKEVFSTKNISNLSTFNKLKPFISEIFVNKGNFILLLNLNKYNNISNNINDHFEDNELVNVCLDSVTVLNLRDISKKFGYNQDYFEITKREIEDPNDKEKKTKIPLIVKYKVQNIFPLKQIFDKIQMKELSLKSNQEGRENREPRNEKVNSSNIYYFLNRLTIGNN